MDRGGFAQPPSSDLAVLWVIECAASFGSQLAHAVTAAGYQVVEAARMSAKANRGVGKSDALDARRIAAAVHHLELDRLRHLRKDDGGRVRVTRSRRQQTDGIGEHRPPSAQVVRGQSIGPGPGHGRRRTHAYGPR